MDNLFLCIIFISLLTFIWAICKDPVNDDKLLAFEKMLNCIDIDFKISSSDILRNSTISLSTNAPNLDSCIATNSSSVCKQTLQEYFMDNPDNIYTKIGKTLLISSYGKTSGPNSCHCLSMYKESIDTCSSILLNPYYKYCNTFYPVRFSSASAINECSKAILSNCNSSTSSYESMIDCVEFNTENLPNQCSVFLGSLFNSVFDSCTVDINRLCSSISSNLVKGCLLLHKQELSPTCAIRLDSYVNTGSPCLSEASVFCKDQRTLTGVLSCLEARMQLETSLDPTCATMVSGLGQCSTTSSTSSGSGSSSIPYTMDTDDTNTDSESDSGEADDLGDIDMFLGHITPYSSSSSNNNGNNNNGNGDKNIDVNDDDKVTNQQTSDGDNRGEIIGSGSDGIYNNIANSFIVVEDDVLEMIPDKPRPGSGSGSNDNDNDDDRIPDKLPPKGGQYNNININSHHIVVGVGKGSVSLSPISDPFNRPKIDADTDTYPMFGPDGDKTFMQRKRPAGPDTGPGPMEKEKEKSTIPGGKRAPTFTMRKTQRSLSVSTQSNMNIEMKTRRHGDVAIQSQIQRGSGSWSGSGSPSDSQYSLYSNSDSSDSHSHSHRSLVYSVVASPPVYAQQRVPCWFVSKSIVDSSSTSTQFQDDSTSSSTSTATTTTSDEESSSDPDSMIPSMDSSNSNNTDSSTSSSSDYDNSYFYSDSFDITNVIPYWALTGSSKESKSESGRYFLYGMVITFLIFGGVIVFVLSPGFRKRFLRRDRDQANWNIGYDRAPTKISLTWNDDEADSSHALTQSEIEMGRNEGNN